MTVKKKPVPDGRLKFLEQVLQAVKKHNIALLEIDGIKVHNTRQEPLALKDIEKFAAAAGVKEMTDDELLGWDELKV